MGGLKVESADGLSDSLTIACGGRAGGVVAEYWIDRTFCEGYLFDGVWVTVEA